MKKISFLLLAFLLTVSACFAEKKTISLNLKKGNTYHQESEADASITQTINGKKIEINMVINTKVSYKVTDINNGVYQMSVKYDEMAMKIKTAAGNQESSSDMNKASDMISSILNKMTTKSFEMTITDKGKIQELKGLNDIFKGIIAEIPGLTDENREKIKSQILESYGDKTFRNSFESCTAIYPDKPVNIKDKWKLKTQLESTISLNMDKEYQLTDIKDNCYVIQENSTTVIDNNAKIKMVNGIAARYNLSGNISSEILVDRTTGWVLSMKSKQILSGETYVDKCEKIPNGTTIPMTITSITTLKGY